MKKRARRLTALKILEVSAVDRGAAMGARIALMKRHKPEFDDAYGLIGRRQTWRRPEAVDKARAEIQANIAAAERDRASIVKQVELGKAKPIATSVEHHMAEDIYKRVAKRIQEMRKADLSIRSDEHALLRLSESRADIDLWRAYRGGSVAPTGAVAKAEDEFSVKKALKHMKKRVEELMAADPTIRSRDSAISKIASSRAEGDREIWDQFRKAADVVDTAPRSGSSTGSALAFQMLCRAIAAAHPDLSPAQVRRWAQATQDHRDPATAALVGHPL